MDKSKQYFEIIRDWLAFVPHEPKAKPVHTALFLVIADKFNVHFYPKQLGIPTNYTMTSLNIGSYNTYKKALLELAEFGFIKITYRAKNQHMANRVELSFFDKAYDKARDKAYDKAYDKAGAKPIDKAPDKPTDSVINKELITNNSKPITVYSFDEFWNDYEKKVGKKEKVRAKFEKLSEEKRDKIKKHIPLYKQSEPNRKYRKNPETYLNNDGWEDEIIVHQPNVNGYSGQYLHRKTQAEKNQATKEAGVRAMQSLMNDAKIRAEYEKNRTEDDIF